MGWEFKADLRGPAGYNATGAAENAQALADFTREAAGPNVFASALRGRIERPATDINLVENFGEASPKILRIRSSSIPGTGVGPNAGRSMAIEVGDSRAKSMFDYRFPVKLVDGKWQIWDFRDGAPPESAYQSVIWGGVFHYWAQDQKDHSNPTDLHNHYSIVEARDDKGALHTIFDVPIGSSNDPTAIGTASHSIRTNRSDFVVRVGNPYDPTLGRAYRLKVAAGTEYEKMMSFHNSTGGQGGTKDMSGVRWEVGVLAGDAADFAIHRFTDVGFSAERPFMFGHRESGKVTFGKKATYQGQVNSIYSADGVDGFYSYREAGTPGDTSAFTGHVGGVGDKAFRTITGVSALERFRIRGDGKHEWLSTGGNADTALYRTTTSTLATDGHFELAGASTRGIIRKSANGDRWLETIGNTGERIVTKL